MDAVPYKFVDSVVELFDGRKTLDPLAKEVAHPLWKAAADVHHRNREYYSIYLRPWFVVEKRGTEYNQGSNDLAPIRKNSRFARITAIVDYSDYEGGDFWEGAETFNEADTVKQLESVALQFEQSSCLVSRTNGGQNILSSLFNRFFAEIQLLDDGQKSLNFLKNQITNSPFLGCIDLKGGGLDRWPKSITPLLRRHETAKSIALCYSNDYYYFLEFRTCECDASEECYLKENYPELHYF
uniref:Uncharacterized protein n=1 Tax=Steinernema glaseri TaxID=37863 RepID=A0A1I7ZDX6_9BILA